MAYRRSKQRTKVLKRERQAKERLWAISGQNPSVANLKREARAISEGYDAAEQTKRAYLEGYLDKLIGNLRSDLEEFEPATIMGLLRLRSDLFSPKKLPAPDAGGERDLDYSVSLVDAAATILYCGQIPDTEKDLSNAQKTRTERLDTIQQLSETSERAFATLRLIRLVSVWLQMLTEGSGTTPDSWLLTRHLSAVQWIRESNYSKLQLELFDSLFGSPEINEQIDKTRGYSYSDLKEAILWLHGAAHHRLELAKADAKRILENSGPVTRQNEDEFINAMERMFAPGFEDVTISAIEMASATDLREETSARILKDFSVDLSAYSTNDVQRFLCDGSNPLFKHPIIRERNDRYLVADESLLVPSIKSNLEEELVQPPSSYGHHRGRAVEELTVELARRLLPNASLYPGLRYTLPDGARGEADLLVLTGDVAIIFEVKSGTVIRPGVAANRQAFRRRITQNIAKASAQVEQLRNLIETEHIIRAEKGEPLDLAAVKEVHTVIVTLDELLDLATEFSNFYDTDLLGKNDQLPWVTSIGDLRLITELTDEPSEFLVYLRRRRDPLIARKYKTTDEMDLFFAFRETGLWAEDETDASTPMPISSMTSPLDNWIHGLAERKPAIKATPLLKYARQVRLRQLPHWFEFGAAVLSLSEKTQFSIEQRIQEILAMTGTDHFAHRTTDVVHDAKPTRYGGVIVFQTTGMLPGPFSSKELIEYLQIKKTQCGVARAFACILDPRGEVTNLIYEGNQIPKSNFSEEEYARLDPC